MDSLAQLSCLKTACKRLGLLYSEKDENGNLVEIDTPKGKFLFANFATPFNSGSVEGICKDKGFTHILLNGVMGMPRTVGYFDPKYREGYERFKKFADVEKIVDDVESKFLYPFVVKRNSGTRGNNVFLCKNKEEVRDALGKIYRKDSPDYDYVALAQEYVKPIAHIRMVLFKGKIVLSYKTEALWGFVDSVGKVQTVSDTEIERFLEPIQKVFPLEFAGADIIQDKKGKLWLLELNSRPGFAQYIREQGAEPVTEMYQKMLGVLC